ncbi:MAG: hypothetical protein JW395_1424 [Nitrospira sp.]|nr:hypothetical protein [Nitrospira sp.]
MEAESLSQIERIVTAATERMRQEMGLMESRLGDRIEETKRHMGVLAEGLRHDVQLVAEAGQLHSERLADIRREVEMQARETRALLQLSYEQIQQRVEVLERRVQLIEQRIGLSV